MVELDRIFQALSSTPRREMLSQLADRPQSVSQLAQRFAMSLAAVSKHLAVLREAGLLEQITEGRVHLCRLRPERLEVARRCLDEMRAVVARRMDGLQSYLELTGRAAPPRPPPRPPPRGPRR